jgi:hypothetical protein
MAKSHKPAGHVARPSKGATGPAKTFRPDKEDPHIPEDITGPRSAPAPGVPMSEEEYRRLKEEAERQPAKSRKDKPAQEDVPKPGKP